jgi:uncharacterized protein with NRDE domain
MCLLALFFRAVDDAPLVIGANREERYDRPATPPQLVQDGPLRFAAGLDLVAGGTWLGVNERGVVAAITNRNKGDAPPQPRSRGLLARQLLGCPSSAAAVEVATRELGTGHYAGCNVVCADAERLVVIHGAEWLRVQPLPPGLHVLTNKDVNDQGDARLGHALWWLGQRPYGRAADCVAALKQLCGQRGDGNPPMCLHGPDRGTVSSTILSLRWRWPGSQYLHANGPPDRAPFDDYSDLLHQLAAERGR